MKMEGLFAPETREAARERYAELGTAAGETVRAVSREMDFDSTEYDERVTNEVHTATQDALFASLLAVQVGSRAEYEQWREAHEGELLEAGSEHVDRVVWHDPPWSDAAVAATFQDERTAAVTTLRRQAFGHLYSEVVR
jgi:hypothetical protein